MKTGEPLGDDLGGHKLTVDRSFSVIQVSGSVLDSLCLVNDIPSLLQWPEMKVPSHKPSKLFPPQVAVVEHFVIEMGNKNKQWLLDFS